MEETLRKLKETHNEKDFIAIVESMRRKIKKGTLDYNLYLFESTLNKLDDNKLKNEDRVADELLSAKTANEDYEPGINKKELENNIEELDKMVEFCEECCKNLDQEIILNQLEEESKELLEGFKYE